MRYLLGLILILALAAGGAYVVAGRQGGPSIQIEKPEKFVGASTPVEVAVGAPGGHLKSLKIVFDQNGKQTTLYEMTGGQPSGDGIKLDGPDKLRVTRTVGKQEVPDLKSGPARIVDWQRRHGNGWKLIGTDVARHKDLPRAGDCRHRITPAGVERQVRNDLRDLARLDTVVEREVEMIWHLDGLIARDKGSQGHNAAVARREAGALPYVAEETVLCIGLQRRGDLPNVLIR